MNNRSVLVIGISNDPAVKLVMTALKQLGATTVLHWNPRNLLNDCAFQYEDGLCSGWLLIDDELTPLDSISGIFNRVSNVELTPEYQSLQPDDPLCIHAGIATENLLQWCEIADCPVLTRGISNEPNSAKAYQLMSINRFFNVPDTLVTNSPEKLHEFATQHRKIIFKSCSGERSIVKELKPDEIDTRINSLENCPVLFQQRIEGFDVRVHVVGSLTFSTSVTSVSTDYRYDSMSSWQPYSLPERYSAACVGLAQSLNLELAGIDLRIAKDGTAFCFEVNPSPAFSAYEEATGQEISAAIASYLSGHSVRQ